ncbi:hypothetical protein R69746_08675 [Paraburkholderia aspalathi]|nr:hypothetical protein R69746_08675 [Paraburkholderia aspalathi]
MSVTANLQPQTRRLAVVVLPQLQAVPCRCLDQMFATPLEQSRIGWMGDRLLHHCCVDDHALHARGLDYTSAFCCFDRLGQQLFNAGFAQALAPARQARRVDRRLGLQVRFAREDLPVRVLHPLPDDLFVGQIKRVLQIQQPRNQARRTRRPAFARHEALAHRHAQSLPVDQVGQTYQRVLQVDLFAQRLPEEISLRHRRLRAHLHLVEKWRILTLMCQVPANLTTPFRTQRSVARGSPNCSGSTQKHLVARCFWVLARLGFDGK